MHTLDEKIANLKKRKQELEETLKSLELEKLQKEVEEIQMSIAMFPSVDHIKVRLTKVYADMSKKELFEANQGVTARMNPKAKNEDAIKMPDTLYAYDESKANLGQYDALLMLAKKIVKAEIDGFDEEE